MAVPPGTTNYPVPLAAPEEVCPEEYTPSKPNNPVLSGYPLWVASKLIPASSLLQSALYSNANFPSLRSLALPGAPLHAVPPRWDPTVIPAPTGGHTPAPGDSPSVRGDGAYYSAADYVAAYRSGKTTPEEVVARVFALLEADAGHRAGFIHVDRERAMGLAREATERYREGRERPTGFDGVPFAVKDEVAVEGMPLTYGTAVVQEVSVESAWCVGRLEAAGGICIGKTNMHELGLDTTNCNINHGTPRNPYNRKHYAGGSSGGSGYVLAAGLVPVAVGCDGGGSIRIPSAYCGVYGLKASHGRISMAGGGSIQCSTSVVGPMAATLADLELAYSIMAQPNPSDPPSAHFPPPTTHPNPSSPRRKYIGIHESYFSACDPSTKQILDKALDRLKLHGYEVINITLPLIPAGQLAHALTILSEISLHPLKPTTDLTPANKILTSAVRAGPYTDMAIAQRVRNTLMQHLSHLFTTHPGLILFSPVAPHPAPRILSEAHLSPPGVSDANASLLSMRFAYLANFTGVPAAAFVCGYEAGTGLPVAGMVTGEWGWEEEVLAAGRVLEGVLVGEVGRRRAGAWVDVLGGVGEKGEKGA